MMTQLDFSAPGPETRWLLLTTRSQPSFYIFFSLFSLLLPLVLSAEPRYFIGQGRRRKWERGRRRKQEGKLKVKTRVVVVFRKGEKSGKKRCVVERGKRGERTRTKKNGLNNSCWHFAAATYRLSFSHWSCVWQPFSPAGFSWTSSRNLVLTSKTAIFVLVRCFDAIKKVFLTF